MSTPLDKHEDSKFNSNKHRILTNTGSSGNFAATSASVKARPDSAKNSAKNSSMRSSKKPTLLMSSGKKGKKKMTSIKNLPGLPSGRSMTGRMSPSIMKVESVKSNVSMKYPSAAMLKSANG